MSVTLKATAMGWRVKQNCKMTPWSPKYLGVVLLFLWKFFNWMSPPYIQSTVKWFWNWKTSRKREKFKTALGHLYWDQNALIDEKRNPKISWHCTFKAKSMTMKKHSEIFICNLLYAQGSMLETSCGSPHYACPEVIRVSMNFIFYSSKCDKNSKQSSRSKAN